MTYRPFASLMLVDGKIASSQIPSQIQYGSWFVLSNIQISHVINSKTHFAATTRDPLHNRRVILVEQPTALPRLLKVLVRSTSDKNKHRSISHSDHDHLIEYPECCCADKKGRKGHVTKEKWQVQSTDVNITTFCCNEPSESGLWTHL